MDHPFEREYGRLWELEVEGIRQVAEHDPDFPVSIEYKPNEPRALSVLPNIAATLLAIEEAGAANLGITLDFAHVLYGDESPAMALALVNRRSRMLGLHINDGYGKRDDGLMVGAVHTVQTIEFLRAAAPRRVRRSRLLRHLSRGCGARPGGRVRGQHRHHGDAVRRHRPAPG